MSSSKKKKGDATNEMIGSECEKKRTKLMKRDGDRRE